MCEESRVRNGGKIGSDWLVSFRLILFRFDSYCSVSVVFLLARFVYRTCFSCVCVCVGVTFGGVLTKLARRESNQHRVNVSHVIA